MKTVKLDWSGSNRTRGKGFGVRILNQYHPDLLRFHPICWSIKLPSGSETWNGTPSVCYRYARESSVKCKLRHLLLNRELNREYKLDYLPRESADIRIYRRSFESSGSRRIQNRSNSSSHWAFQPHSDFCWWLEHLLFYCFEIPTAAYSIASHKQESWGVSIQMRRRNSPITA